MLDTFMQWVRFDVPMTRGMMFFMLLYPILQTFLICLVLIQRPTWSAMLKKHPGDGKRQFFWFVVFLIVSLIWFSIIVSLFDPHIVQGGK